MEHNKTVRKLRTGIAAVIALSLCLCVTTLALFYSLFTVKDNPFQTGAIRLNLNGGEPVMEDREFLFEPGMTVEKEFYIENEGTWDVYYRIYLENVTGTLAEKLIVTVWDGEDMLFSGKANELTAQTTQAAQRVLRTQERRKLTMTFCLPKSTGNAAQGGVLAFDLKADAVQTKNNPDRLFE